MFQTAVFVDAGYLYAQGSALLAGSKQSRSLVRLNVSAMLDDLIAEVRLVEPGARLLRIYWYDGLIRGGSPSFEQGVLATSHNVKCRFGTVNSRGEQKGVDSLIVTDLIELARGGAISDALIMSGDEDIRVGVQVAQSFGIRVHLLGIEPSRASQSPDLIAEADTWREWLKAQVGKWLTIIAPPTQQTAAGGVHLGSDAQILAALIVSHVQALSPEQVSAALTYTQANSDRLPPDLDRPALGSAKKSLGRELTHGERKQYRLDIIKALEACSPPRQAD